jgi:acyl carrier protein
VGSTTEPARSTKGHNGKVNEIVEETSEGAAGETAPAADEEELAAAFEKFRNCAVDVLGVKAEQVTRQATFEELEADSLDLVELVMALEEAFEITVEEEELDGVKTIEQAFSLVTSKI